MVLPASIISHAQHMSLLDGAVETRTRRQNSDDDHDSHFVHAEDANQTGLRLSSAIIDLLTVILLYGNTSITGAVKTCMIISNNYERDRASA